MPATFINAALVLLGSLLGMLFKDHIGARFHSILTHALGLCVLGIGISSAVGTENTLCVIVCMVLGTILGEALRIEDRLDSVGEVLRKKLVHGGGNTRFTEGFVTASVLFCVGSMAIMGSMEAGIQGKYDILISKGGHRRRYRHHIRLRYGAGRGLLRRPPPPLPRRPHTSLLLRGSFLDPAAITEMSAVGGTIIMGIAVNMLGLGKGKIRVGNMLPAIFPAAAVPPGRISALQPADLIAHIVPIVGTSFSLPPGPPLLAGVLRGIHRIQSPSPVFYAIHKSFHFRIWRGSDVQKSFELVLPPVNSLKKELCFGMSPGFERRFSLLPLAHRGKETILIDAKSGWESVKTQHKEAAKYGICQS